MMKLTLILLALCVASCVGEWPSALRPKRNRYGATGNGNSAQRYSRNSPGRMGNKHNKRELTPDGTELAELPLEITDVKEPHIEKIWTKLLEMFTNFRNAMKEIRHTISETTKRVMRHVMNK